MATSPSQLAMGVSTEQRWKWRAVNEAMAQCKRSGAPDCQLRVSYRNECVAVAAPDAPGPGDLTVSTGEDPPAVINTAMALCFSTNRGDCSVGYLHCNAAEWVRY